MDEQWFMLEMRDMRNTLSIGGWCSIAAVGFSVAQTALLALILWRLW